MAAEIIADMGGQGDGAGAIPTNLSEAAGSSSVGVMDKIWGADGGSMEDEGAAEPAAPAAPAAPVAPAEPVVAAPDTGIDDITGLPTELSAVKAAPVVAAAPAAGSPEEAAEEAKAQQTIQALPEKAQKEAFIDLRRQLKDERTRRKELEAKTSEATKNLEAVRAQTGQATADALTTVTKELETTKAKLDSMEAELGKTNYGKSTEYQEKYVLPAQGVVAKMAKLAETVGGRTKEESVALVRQLIGASPQERVGLLSNESVAVQGALLSASSDYDELAENGKIAMDNWKNRQAAVDDEQRRSNRMGLVKHLFEDTEKATSALSQEGNVLFSRTQNPDWNKGVDERVAAVRGVLQSGDPAVLVKYVADGVSAPKWREMYWKVTQAYAALKKEAKGIIGATPGVGGGEGGDGGAAAPVAKPKTGEEVMNRVWGTSR